MNIKTFLWRAFLALLILSNIGKVAKAVKAVSAQAERASAVATVTPQAVTAYLHTEVYDIASRTIVGEAYMSLSGAGVPAARNEVIKTLNFSENGIEVRTTIVNGTNAPWRCSKPFPSDNVTINVYSQDEELSRLLCEE